MLPVLSHHAQGGRLVLPELYLTDSSEALLSGRKPPFRLLVRARHVDGRKLSIRHAVSEPFVVATRRVRASHKVGNTAVLQSHVEVADDSTNLLYSVCCYLP